MAAVAAGVRRDGRGSVGPPPLPNARVEAGVGHFIGGAGHEALGHVDVLDLPARHLGLHVGGELVQFSGAELVVVRIGARRRDDVVEGEHHPRLGRDGFVDLRLERGHRVEALFDRDVVDQVVAERPDVRALVLEPAHRRVVLGRLGHDRLVVVAVGRGEGGGGDALRGQRRPAVRHLRVDLGCGQLGGLAVVTGRGEALVVDPVRADLPAVGGLQLFDLGPGQIGLVVGGPAGVRHGRHTHAVGDDIVGAGESVLLKRRGGLGEGAEIPVVEGERHQRRRGWSVNGGVRRRRRQEPCDQCQHRPCRRGELGVRT